MVRRCRSASCSFCWCSTINRRPFILKALQRFLVFISLTLARRMCAVGLHRDGINVALHAQVPPSSEMVVGSAVTMAGVRQALLRRSTRSGEAAGKGCKNTNEGHSRDIKIAHAQVFYPFEYGGLHERHWDLVIIEGWFKMINVFIHEVRAVGYPRPTVVLFYCLDPRFPGLPHVSALDVDGFLTNSASTQRFLQLSAPTALIPLAVDTEAFPFYPNSPRSTANIPGGLDSPRSAANTPGDPDSSCVTSNTRGDPDSPCVASNTPGDSEIERTEGGRLVYVGAAGALEYKEMLAWMLREAAPYGLDIYGSGWKDVPEFLEYWRGVLPEGDLASVYGRALAVIGVTMDAQRESGMINNRVFEVMSVGAPLISEHFPALEALFGDAILYVRHPGDVARHVEHILLHYKGLHTDRGEIEAHARQRRRAMIEENHTWSRRVEDILAFGSSLPGNELSSSLPRNSDLDLVPEEEKGGQEARCSRQGGCLTLAIVVDPNLEEDITFGSTFVPAVSHLASMYRTTWWTAPPQEKYQDHAGQTIRRQSTGGGHGAGETTTRDWRRMKLPLDVDYLDDYDVVWAAGRWGGPADNAVRELLSPEEDSGLRSTMPRISTQARGMVLWGSPCAPDAVFRNERGRWKGVREGGCPDYGGDAGLRWYDVVYCQTVWDHEFLVKAAFNGSVSDNLQQAWGFGSPVLPGDDPDGGGEETRSTSNPSVSQELLVIGTDTQFLDMLHFAQSADLASVALAVVASPGGAMARSGLAPTLQSEYMDVGVDAARGSVVTDLPTSFSLHVGESSSNRSPFSPLTAEVMLVRNTDDADALARLASVAAKIVIAAAGQVGLWATLLTAAHGRHPRGREHAQVVVDNTSGDGRIQALVDQWPHGWSLHFYSRRLIGGMTRAFCLGRGTSRISVVRPLVGSVTVVGLNDTVTMEVLVEDFDVGRDGQWCITAGGRTLICLLRNEFVVDVHVSSSSSTSERDWEALLARSGSPGSSFPGEASGRSEKIQAVAGKKRLLGVEMAVELRSNMYTDVLYRSEPVRVMIDPLSEGTDGAVRCRYEDGIVADCNRSTRRSGIADNGGHADNDHDGSHRSAYRVSINAEDFLQASTIEGTIEVVDGVDWKDQPAGKSLDVILL